MSGREGSGVMKSLTKNLYLLQGGNGNRQIHIHLIQTLKNQYDLSTKPFF